MPDAPITDTVDTPAAESTAGVPLSLPSPTDLPRDEAQQSADLAAGVLAAVCAAVPRLVLDVEQASDARRRMAVLADTTAKRGLSKAATRDMLTALRITERALGMAMEGTPRNQWREYAPDSGVRFRCLALAEVDQEEFDAAIHAWRRPGGFASFESLLEIIRGNTPESEELDTEPVEDQHVMSADEVKDTVTRGLASLADTARILRTLTPEHFGALTPEFAHDAAGRVWTDAVPVLVARKNLLERGAH